MLHGLGASDHRDGPGVQYGPGGGPAQIFGVVVQVCLSRGGHTRHNTARQRARARPAPVSAGGAAPRQEQPFNNKAGCEVWAAGCSQREPSAPRATSLKPAAARNLEKLWRADTQKKSADDACPKPQPSLQTRTAGAIQGQG